MISSRHASKATTDPKAGTGVIERRGPGVDAAGSSSVRGYLVRCLQRGCRIALPLLLSVVIAGCQRIENNTGISEQQQLGFVGGAAGGALIAGAAGASAPWIVGGALIGAGLGTGIATVGTQGQSDEPPSGETFNDFLANPPGTERSWRNPANDDHGTVTIAGETREANGTLCKRLAERCG